MCRFSSSVIFSPDVPASSACLSLISVLHVFFTFAAAYKPLFTFPPPNHSSSISRGKQLHKNLLHCITDILQQPVSKIASFATYFTATADTALARKTRWVCELTQGIKQLYFHSESIQSAVYIRQQISKWATWINRYERRTYHISK